VSRGTQELHTLPHVSPTGLSPSLMLLSNSFGSRLVTLMWVLQPQGGRSHTGLGSSRFARHYSGNLG
jgi:hypothetical protein